MRVPRQQNLTYDEKASYLLQWSVENKITKQQLM
jgi:hypothetical protein